MTDFIPQKGDHVTVKGQTGVYVVYLVDTSMRVAEVMERRSGLRLSTIPWDSLTSLAEEEAQRKPGNVDRVILLDPINFSVFYCTPWRYSGCPACGPNLFTCS
jgi:hypothetical protein